LFQSGCKIPEHLALFVGRALRGLYDEAFRAAAKVQHANLTPDIDL
jgi:hypothetical protein